MVGTKKQLVPRDYWHYQITGANNLLVPKNTSTIKSLVQTILLVPKNQTSLNVDQAVVIAIRILLPQVKVASGCLERIVRRSRSEQSRATRLHRFSI
jgi:hypothetical protein